MVNSKLSEIVKQLAVLLNANIIIAIISYLLTLYIINKFSVEQFGVYSLVLIWGAFGSLWLSFCSEHTASSRYVILKNETKLVTEVSILRLVNFTILITLLFILYICKVLNLTMFVGVLAVSLVAANFSYVFEIRGKNHIYAYIYLLERVIYVCVTGLCIYLLDFPPIYVFSVLLVITIISLIFQFFYIDLYHKFQMGTLVDLTNAIKTNVFIFFSSIAVYSYGGFSRVVLEFNLTIESLAIYSAAWQFIMIITLYQAQIERIWRLKLSVSINNHQRTSFLLALKQFVYFSTIPCMLLGLLTFLFSDVLVILLFSEKYESAATIVKIFSFYYLIINLDSAVKMIIVAIHKSKIYFAIHALCGSSLIIFLLISKSIDLSLFAISVLFAHGAAVAMLAGYSYLEINKSFYKDGGLELEK